MWTPGGQIDHLTFAGMRGGKGGRAAPPAPPTYTDPQTGMAFNDPNALNAEINQRTQQAASDKAAADAKAASDAAAAESTFQTNKQGAYNDALNSIMQTFKGQGVDPNNYMNYITPALNQAASGIPDLATNIGSYFPTSLGQTILNQATGDYRTGLTNRLNQTFGPTYAANQLPTSTMDPAIQSILSNQFDPLSTELQNAQKRGRLTDAGYQAAVNKMNQDKAAAQSQLTSLGQNILTSDRGALDTLASGARSDIANANLGSNLDPSQYVTQANQMVSQDVSGFPGALQSAAGNVTFGDIQDLLNAGGAVQGGTNPTATAQGPGGASPASLYAQDQTTKRGLGTTGAF